MFDVIRKAEYWHWQDAGWADPPRHDLKGIQDAYILSRLHDVASSRILEIGGGNSRVLARLSQTGLRNECWNADRFEGVGQGPLNNSNDARIRTVPCFIGDFDETLPTGHFDYVISVSVVEHVPVDRLDDFFADSARLLRTGGILLHAIDLYVFDAGVNNEHRQSAASRLRRYLHVADKSDIPLRLREPAAIDENVHFECAFATNSDNAMNHWNQVVPSLRSTREAAQSVSLKAEWIKPASRSTVSESSRGDQDFEQRCESMEWFHSIDFGTIVSRGRFPEGQPQNSTLYGAMGILANTELHGAAVLDVGTVDGLAGFGMVRLGARRVVATDSFERETFLAGRDHLALDIDYRPGLQVRDLVDALGAGSFDLVLCCGVIYHMLNPASAFFECRKLVKDGGLLIIESAYEKEFEQAVIFVNSEEEIYDEVHTYSVPTKRAVVGLMRLAGFDVLATRTLDDPDRLTVLGRAVPVNEVRARTALTKRIHDVDFCDFDFRLKDLKSSPTRSSARYSGPLGDARIDQHSFRSDFPFHPAPGARTVGRSAWRR